MTRILIVLVTLVSASAVADRKAVAKKVTVTDTAIELSEPIYFEFSKATIKKESYAILDAVVAAFKSNKQLALVEIQGHTDARGNDEYNLEVSARRARAIEKYLVGRGVSAKRLRAKGYGETLPLDQGNTEAAWAKNRRMAFVILQRQK